MLAPGQARTACCGRRASSSRIQPFRSIHSQCQAYRHNRSSDVIQVANDSPEALHCSEPSSCPDPISWQQQISGLLRSSVCRTVVGLAAAAVCVSTALVPVGLSLGGAAHGVIGGPQAAQAVTTEQLLFLEAWRAVDRAYVDKGFNGQSWFRVRETFLKKESFDSRADTYEAIRKLLVSLDDPFTRFLEPSRLSQLRGGTQRGSVTGVGLEVTFTEGSALAGSQLRVVAPAEGGPSDRAGIRSGDVIAAVDGHPTAGISLYEASDLLQGPTGSPVTLTVRSPGPDGRLLQPRDVPLVREVISVRPVSYTTCRGVSPATGLQGRRQQLAEGAEGGGAVEYVRVSTFNSNTVEGVVAALKEAKAVGVDGLILDLRNNGGGLFPAGVQVAKLLLSGGDIVLISDSAGVRDIVSANGSGVLDTSTPLSVWVNRGTASASEVLAGALKDNGRGVVVGDGTFGKGLIQTVVDLSDGSGLAITVAKYQTPAGVDINRVGITPDIRRTPDSLAIGEEAVCRQLAGQDAPRVFG